MVQSLAEVAVENVLYIHVLTALGSAKGTWTGVRPRLLISALFIEQVEDSSADRLTAVNCTAPLSSISVAFIHPVRSDVRRRLDLGPFRFRTAEDE
jgi:hypothetical protein